MSTLLVLHTPALDAHAPHLHIVGTAFFRAFFRSGGLPSRRRHRDWRAPRGTAPHDCAAAGGDGAGAQLRWARLIAQRIADDVEVYEREAGDAELTAVHTPTLVHFVSHCWASMRAVYPPGSEKSTHYAVLEYVPDTYGAALFAPLHTRRDSKAPLFLAGGLYCSDTSTPITEHTAAAARKSAALAMEAARRLQATPETLVYALCRPPGHHASTATYGGYCYFNNAALAADVLAKAGRVVVFDIDYHHGNGTQEIFYRRSDVYYVSIHADPDYDYPYYWGGADERGDGDGAGFNRNFPLPLGSTFTEYEPAFDEALRVIHDYDPKYVIISLGLDAAAGDTVGSFLLYPSDYHRIGTALRGLGTPLMVVQEGGYSADETLSNVAYHFLAGLKGTTA